MPLILPIPVPETDNLGASFYKLMQFKIFAVVAFY
jgi:hypothetical protein